MKKIPNLEINCIPSALNTSAPTGVASQLASVAEIAPKYDGITIEQMKGNPLFDRIDDIDKIGLAKKKMTEITSTVRSNLGKIRQINSLGQRIQKPSNSN